MSRKLKKEIYEVINSSTVELNEIEISRCLKEVALECESKESYDNSRSYTKWTDDELRIIFSHPPTEENCIKLAKVFKRNIGSIEQIYRWSVQTKKRIDESGKGNDAFIRQVKSIAKEQGWVTV